MTKAKKTALFSAIITFILCVMIALGCIAASDGEQGTGGAEGYSVRLTADENNADMVDIAVDQNCKYIIIFSTSGTSEVQNVANAVRKALYDSVGKYIDMKPQTQRETEFEILIGSTNREVSKNMLALVQSQATAEKPYVWAYGYRDGKLFYVASNDTAFSLGREEFLSIIDEDGKLSVPANLFVINSMSQAEYDKYLADKAEAERQERIEALKEMNEAFKSEPKLNNGYQSMIGDNGVFQKNPYASPWVYPADDQHPRYLITEKDLERILEMMDDPQYEVIFNNLWYWAEKDINNGVFKVINPGAADPARYSESVITGIQARAMAYLLTGDEEYAYEAIIGIKNAMLTLHFTTDIHMDIYHGSSHVIVALAAVYDWCYDVLSEEDKWQIITGTVTCLWPSMEFVYPPTNLSGFGGHGTGPQFLRDYMSLAVAFYDEAPDWWEFIMGRYFEEYLPAANAQFVNGWISQGTACYAPIKLMVQLWAANLIKVSAGDSFLTEDAAACIHMFISQIQPNGNYFQTGDGGRTPQGSKPGFAEYLVSAALFNDPIAFAWAKYHSDNFSKYNTDSIFTMPPDFQLCFIARMSAEEVDKYESVGLIQYRSDPIGQMTARNSWDTDAAAVFMKVGNITMAGHDIYEHGTFQIYYKGLLAADSGSYKHYGGDSHYYYLQATVAHNGLLIFNPTYAGDAIMNGDKVTNPGTYYYSGSQHRLSMPNTLSEWQNGSYTMAETTGAAYEYNRDGSTRFAYLAGDITDAYDDKTVDYVGRRMLTIYTGDEEIPMVFLTFDEITSDKDNYEKTYLLHTINEPTLDADSMTAEIISGEGRMIFKSLYGAQVMEKIGGEGKAYWINGYYKEDGTYVEGKNCLDEYTPDDNYMNIWGRIQLRTSGELTTNFLNAMYVSDSTSEATLDIEKFQNEYVYGASFGNSIVAFAIGKEKTYKTFSFDTEGKGLYNYYVSGITDGTWNVKVDGVSVAYSLSSDEAGIITFTAPTGHVELIPGSNVIGANGGKIQYNTGGAVLPNDAPYAYNNEQVTVLPTNVTRGEDIFMGWYLSSDFLEEERVYEVPAGTTGTFRVYAKWLATFMNEDYSKSIINAEKSVTTVNGITYHGEGKPGSSFKTKTDDNGRNYLEWIEGEQDSFIYSRNTSTNMSTAVSEDKSISITLEIDSEDGKPNLASSFQMVTKVDVNGSAISSQHTVIFKTDTNGNIKLGSSTIGKLTEDGTCTLRIVIDFKYGQFKAYDESKNLIASTSFSPSGAIGTTSTEESMKCYNDYIFYWHGDSPADKADSTMRIYKIKMQDGNVFELGGAVGGTGIQYNVNGGTLPSDAPYEYSVEEPTVLPIPTRPGCVFEGWYTTESFDEGTRTYYVPTTTEGAYKVYAKWKNYLVDESYEGKDFSIIENSGSNGSLSYNAGSANDPKPGSSFVTETDGSGNTYVKASVGSVNSILFVASNSHNLTHFTETAISYEFSLKKLADVAFPNISISITTLRSTYAALSVMKINEAGEATLAGSSETFATVGEDAYTTFRITVDFAAATIYAYDADGEVISSVKITSVPAGLSSLVEWQKVASNYLFYMALNRTKDAQGDVSSLAVDNVKIAEGNIFYKEAVVIPVGSGIIYRTDGGTLPADAPKEYDSENGTLLPNNVVRDGYIFGGWYTSADLAESSKVYFVPVGTKGSFPVYAKWLPMLTDETFDETTVDIGVEKPGQNEIAGVVYNNLNGVAFKTESDASGNKYLRITNVTPAKNAVIRTTNASYNITNFAETAISFEMSFAKIPDMDLSLVSWSLESSGGVGGSGRLDLLVSDVDGNITLRGSEKVIGTITEGAFTTVRMSVDFALGTVSAYDASGKVLDTVSPAAPGGFKSFADWQKTGLKHHLLFINFVNPNEKDSGKESGIFVDGIKVIEGRAFAEAVTEIPANTSISYVTGGATLPEGAPTDYDPENGTILPGNIVRDGYIFGGWYTTSDFEEGTEMDYIPAGRKSAVTVYAKWLNILTDEDYSETEIDLGDSNRNQPEIAGVIYNHSNPGAYFKTESDDDGNTYLRVDTKVAGQNAVIRTTDASYNISNFTETAVSFEISFSKIPGVDLSHIGWNLESSSYAGGSGRLDLVGIDADGNIKLAGSENVIGTVTEGIFTNVKICVDFALGTVTAYDADNKVIDFVKPAAPDGFATFADWQKTGLKHHILFMSIANINEEDSGIETGVLIGGIKITEGRAFRAELTSIPADSSIKYEVGEGQLPAGAFKKYDTELGYTLPTPTREGYIFEGWYTSADFSEDSLITEIVPGTTGTVTVYAKWKEIVICKITYELNGGELAEGAPTEYICGTEVDLPEASQIGMKFMGWYTTPDFEEGTLITKIPADATGDITLYAYFDFDFDFGF